MEGEERGDEDGGDMKEGEQTCWDQFKINGSFVGLYCHDLLFGNHLLWRQWTQQELWWKGQCIKRSVDKPKTVEDVTMYHTPRTVKCGRWDISSRGK